MKRLFLILAGFVCLLAAQAQETPMEDKDRVALTAVVEDDEIPAGAHKQLINKMNQIAAKNGCAAVSNSRFIITCSADVLTKDITPTAPPMHAYTLSINFFVGDGVEGRLFSSCAIEAKGVGQTPDKAYLNALRSVRVNDPAFKAMIDKGKEEIIAYYNSRCALVLRDAEAKKGRGEYTEALALLTAVPPVCEECYRKALDASVETYQAWRDHVCEMALQKAQAAWATRDAKVAADALTQIPPDGACAAEAKELRQQIAGQLDERERQEWDFKMQQYEDMYQLAAQEARAQEVEIVSDQGTNSHAVMKKEQVRQKAIKQLKQEKTESAKTPTYQVKGKWFK